VCVCVCELKCFNEHAVQVYHKYEQKFNGILKEKKLNDHINTLYRPFHKM